MFTRVRVDFSTKKLCNEIPQLSYLILQINPALATLLVILFHFLADARAASFT